MSSSPILQPGGSLASPSPSPAGEAPPTAAGGGGAGQPVPPPPTVSISLSSVDPPVVAEYAELTPDSTGPVVTALDERALMSRLMAERSDAAEHEVAADGGGPPRVDELA